jgi:hypothetical protein
VYFNFLGGSALLHLLAAYPRVVAAFGIAGTVAALITSMGPQGYMGVGGHIRALDRSVVSSHVVNPSIVDDAVVQARRMAEMPRDEIRPIVASVLRECGRGCGDLTSTVVMRDPALLQQALYVWALNHGAADRSAAARAGRAQSVARR